MKYKSIKEAKPESYTVCDFSGGMSGNINEYSDSNCFKKSENLWHKNGDFVTRPAFKKMDNTTLPIDITNELKLTVTDTVYYLEGKKYNIAYYSTGDGYTYENIQVFLIGDCRNIISLGEIMNTRVDEHIFYALKSVYFIVGEPTNGLGIYAFLTLVRPGVTNYSIFEVTDDENHDWITVPDDDMYIPTVLYNGKGNKAAEATEEFGFDLGEETSPEPLNIICPKFKAYYTSDGKSWCFFLPEKNLDNETVKCTIHLSDTDVLIFNIPASGSTVVTYNGTSVSAYCDRTEGKISFVSGGVAWNVPRTESYPRNNIEIIASKPYPGGREKVIGCRYSVVFNSRAYVYGNDIKPNEIYSCRVTHPLYFPENCKAEVGSYGQRITGVGYQNNKLIVFKEGEIYKLNIQSGNSASKVYSSYGNMNGFLSSDVLSSETISTKTGCINKECIASVTGQLVWLGSDKKVYTLEATTYGSEKNIFEISDGINAELLKYDFSEIKPFAIADSGYYYLFCDNDVYVCNCHINNMGYAKRYGSDNRANVGWYKWSLPHHKILSGALCSEIMIGVLNDEDTLQYFASFCDDKYDTVLYKDENGVVKAKELPIAVSFESKDYSAGYNGKKKFLRLMLEGNLGEKTDISLVTDKNRFKMHIHNSDDVAVLISDPFILPSYKASFSFKGGGKIKLNSATLEYIKS